jgi:hypothetical protein
VRAAVGCSCRILPSLAAHSLRGLCCTHRCTAERFTHPCMQWPPSFPFALLSRKCKNTVTDIYWFIMPLAQHPIGDAGAGVV